MISSLLVAPHAGAWIETILIKGDLKWHGVAPHAGAWIETGSTITGATIMGGRAPCGRVD